MKAYAPVYHILVLAGLGACNGDGGKDTTDDTDTGATATTAVEAVCTEPTELTCVDEIISDLSLHDDLVADSAEVSDRVAGDDFVTTIDATAGGFGNETANPWVYVKFTPEGAQRVDIDDETALDSMEWHLAARRFVLRLNGGSSGPSCVGAAAFIEQSYEDLTEVPDDVNYVYDDFYSGDCTLINDASGLDGSPQVALGPWWDYPGCVETTDVPFLVQLEDGHVIKLRVEQYYTEQDSCNNDGFPSGTSGMFKIRWTFLR
ncbi:MAG: HmuY family protein [Myxococcota bacterium]